ncbi:methyltransferase domain-containing protein [Actinopolyspora mortivallis]|uniref:methyltransferase domain-containing protein n=1 Tax=Actinopolyspora mortivallis TaxID=33906 RepID=UPI000379A1DC
MLTVDFDKLGVLPGQRVLDLGCGAGRHAFELYRRGLRVVAFDHDEAELDDVAAMFAAMEQQGEVPAGAEATTVRGDALELPFPAESFDHVIASEILEHIPADDRAMRELVRVLKPGGRVSVTVPSYFPERVCWALSEAYHNVEGGHVRIYRRGELLDRLRAAGLRPVHHHHAHALHSPYWWLKCAVGVNRTEHPLTGLYHRMLVWDMLRAPWVTRSLERALNPVLGKSLVTYLYKPAGVAVA